MKKRKVTAEDLLKIKFVESVAIAPDELEILVTVKTIAEDKKKYFSHLYMVDIEGTNLRQYTFGEVSDSHPVFSPDGNWIAFTSKRREKKGLYLMPRKGGEARALVDKDGSYSELSFSPDSKKILCVFRKADDVPKDKDGKKEPPVYRHIDRLLYKMDNLGFYPKEQGQIWAFDVSTGKGTQLTKGGYTKQSPTFSPDGRYIAYLHNVQRDPDRDPDLNDIFVLPAKGGKNRRIPAPKGPKASLRFSPNGMFLAYLGHDNPDDPWGVTNWHLWKVPFRGGQAVDLTKNMDRMAVDVTISDMAEGHASDLHWSSDSRSIYTVVSDCGATHLYKVSAGGRGRQADIGGKIHLTAFSLSGKKTRIAALISTPISPAELHILDLNGRKAQPRKITAFNKPLLDEVKIVQPEEIYFKAYDGYRLHGWILKPPDFSANKRYPSILEIHGGPRVQYGHTFFHEMQFLAASGYVVYYANPRGGQGYGEKHADFITNNWGTVDHDDCMAFADFMEKKPYIDKKKMGVTGGSYGGYMTNWIVTHTNRFAAAVTQRSVVNLESMFGSSDIGYLLPKEIKGTPYSDPANYRRMSPLTFVKKVRTPLLISHSEQDLRCPIEQAEQLYASLKLMGRKVEMIRFPDEPHGLSRCGRPDRRLARLEWFKKWFDRYLKGKKV